MQNENYSYNEYNTPVIVNMLHYINGSKNEDEKYFIGELKDFDLNKGIMLAGNVGVGKSELFKILHRYCYVTKNPNAFRIESIETLSMHFKKNSNFDFFNERETSLNIGGVKRYGIHLCINEFGYNLSDKNYGVNFSDSFSSFIMRRYELFKSTGLLTHATTNMNKEELIESFDPPVVDRMKEMFNLVPVGGSSYRQ